MINTKKKPSIERADRRQEGSAGTGAAAGDKEGRRRAGPGPDPLDNNNHFSRGTRRVDTFPPADDTPAARQPRPHPAAASTRQQLHLHDGAETPESDGATRLPE